MPSNKLCEEIQHAIETHQLTRLKELITPQNIDIEDERYGYTPLAWAGYKGDLSTTKWLIEQGANLKFKTKSKDGLLSVASRPGDINKIKYIISLGYSIEDEARRGKNPIFSTIVFSRSDLLQYYLELCPQFITSVDEYNNNILMYAALHGRQEIVSFIINNYKEFFKNSGREALVSAIRYCICLKDSIHSNHYSLIKMLLDNGVKCDQGILKIASANAALKNYLITLIDASKNNSERDDSEVAADKKNRADESSEEPFFIENLFENLASNRNASPANLYPYMTLDNLDECNEESIRNAVISTDNAPIKVSASTATLFSSRSHASYVHDKLLPASSYGINASLNEIYGNSAHIIRPQKCALYSFKQNSADKKAVCQLLSEIQSCVDEDGGQLKKPIIAVMDINSPGTATSSSSPALSSLPHWVAVVILNANYKFCSSTRETLFVIDAKYPDRDYEPLHDALMDGLSYGSDEPCENGVLVEQTHYMDGPLNNITYIEPSNLNKQPVLDEDCGYFVMEYLNKIIETGSWETIVNDHDLLPAMQLRSKYPQLMKNQITHLDESFFIDLEDGDALDSAIEEEDLWNLPLSP